MERLSAARQLATEMLDLLGSIGMSSLRDVHRAPVKAAVAAAAMQVQVLDWAIKYAEDQPPRKDPVAAREKSIDAWVEERLPEAPPMTPEQWILLQEILGSRRKRPR